MSYMYEDNNNNKNKNKNNNYEKFDNNNNKNKKIIILHYATWCGYCNKLKPIWDEIKKYCKDNEYTYYEVNHSVSDNINVFPTNDINIPLEIYSFPTIQIYNNNTFTIYEGERNYNNIIKALIE